MIDNILHLYRNFYYSLPQSMKLYFGSLYGSLPLSYRFGKSYSHHHNILRNYENWNDQRQLDYTFNKTKESVLFADRHIKYYSQLFRNIGFNAENMSSFEDMKNIPPLTKELVKNHLQDLYTFKIEKGTEYITGGSTSIPTLLYLPLLTSRGKEKAYINYMFSKIGYRYRDRTVLLKGREVAKPQKGIYWEHEPIDNYLVLSSNYLKGSYISGMYEQIRKFRPVYFFGFPSSIIDFIKGSQSIGISSINGIKGVMLVSENIYNEHVEMIREFFQSDVLIEYGHTERAVIAYNKGFNKYIFLNSYGLVNSYKGEVMATTFDNFVMPLIKYLTDDYLTEEKEFYNGTDILRGSKSIDGKSHEYLVTKDKRLISISAMGAGHFNCMKDIDAFEYQQREIGHVKVNVQSKRLTNDNMEILQRQLESHTGDSITFDIKLVEHIEKTHRGKRNICDQHLNLSEYR